MRKVTGHAPGAVTGKAPAPAPKELLCEQEFLPFNEALACAIALKLNNQNDWETWCKTSMRPADIPACPHKVYKQEGWQGYGHWLGTGNEGHCKPKALPTGTSQTTEGILL